MPERVFIFHGYQGFPGEAWQPWLKAELERRGYEVSLPAMPNADHPTIPEWTRFIAGLVGRPDAQTVLIGHSLGAQAVLRYLETLGGSGQSVSRTILIASNFPFGMPAEAANLRTGGDPVLLPWLTTGVNPDKVRRSAGKCIVILSDNDPYIPFTDAKASFEASLAPTIVVVPGKGHFNEDDRITELPAALDAVLA